MKEINCIFCNIENRDIYIEENGYTGRKCKKCGLIYISPRPSLNEIIDLYGHDNAHLSAKSHIADGFAKRLYARHDLKLIKRVVSKGALLEIGAGGGHFLDEARKIGFDPHGVEFNSLQADYIRTKLQIPCEESSIDPSMFGGKKFDVIYFCDVISHLYEPISDFRIFNSMMKSDSYLVFETGNFGEMSKKYFTYIRSFQYPDHLFFFNTNNLVDLLGRSGFEVVSIYKYSILPQLFLAKIVGIIMGKWRGKVENTPDKNPIGTEPQLSAGETGPGHAGIKQRILAVVRNAYKFTNYLLRYKLGSMIQNSQHPQTMVVIAKKAKNVR